MDAVVYNQGDLRQSARVVGLRRWKFGFYSDGVAVYENKHTRAHGSSWHIRTCWMDHVIISFLLIWRLSWLPPSDLTPPPTLTSIISSKRPQPDQTCKIWISPRQATISLNEFFCCCSLFLNRSWHSWYSCVLTAAYMDFLPIQKIKLSILIPLQLFYPVQLEMVCHR